MAFFKYSLFRGILFLVFFLAAYYWLGVSYLSAGLIAVVFAFLISFIFLRGQRDKATRVIAGRFAPNAQTTQSVAALADADAEDALIDANPDIRVDADRDVKESPDVKEPDTKSPETKSPDGKQPGE